MRDETKKTGTRYGMEEAYWGPSIKAYAARHQTIEGGNCGYIQGRRNEKRARGADFVEGHRQNFKYVKIHTLEFRGSVTFFLRQILTDHILSIASAITLDIREI